jgi:hypothetical protein
VIRFPSMVAACWMAAVNHVAAQPLYLGDQDVDTTDREAMSAIVERCAALAAQDEQPGSGLLSASPLQDDQMVGDPNLTDKELELVDAGNPFAGPVGLEAVVSAGEGAQAAGEGSGGGVPTSGNGSTGGEEASSLKIDQITLEMCKGAGIVF